MTPVLTDLGGGADQPLHRGARPSGRASGAAVLGAASTSMAGAGQDKPIITDVGQLAAGANPLTNSLAALRPR
jgi:hypothetical protein